MIANRLAATASTTQVTRDARNALCSTFPAQEIDNVGGGNCFWISVAVSTCSLGSPTTVQSLKQDAVAIIRNMNDDQVVTLLNYLSADGVPNATVDSYCVALEGNSSFYGGDLEAMLLSSTVGPIHIYAPTAGGDVVQHSFFTNENGDMIQSSHPFDAAVGDVAPTDGTVRLVGGEIGPYPTSPVRILLSRGHYTALVPTDNGIRFESSAFVGVRDLITTRRSGRIRVGIRQAPAIRDVHQGTSMPTNPAATKRPAEHSARHPTKRPAKGSTAGDELNEERQTGRANELHEEGQVDGNAENVLPNQWVLPTPNVSWALPNGSILKYQPRVPHRVDLSERRPRPSFY